jgi:hypothetical protein
MFKIKKLTQLVFWGMTVLIKIVNISIHKNIDWNQFFMYLRTYTILQRKIMKQAQVKMK